MYNYVCEKPRMPNPWLVGFVWPTNRAGRTLILALC